MLLVTDIEDLHSAEDLLEYLHYYEAKELFPVAGRLWSSDAVWQPEKPRSLHSLASRVAGYKSVKDIAAVAGLSLRQAGELRRIARVGGMLPR